MEKINELYTWEQIVKAKPGTIFMDKFDEGVRFIVMRGGASLCGYIGIPIDHPLAGFDYDSIPAEAHGGLTYADSGSERFPKGYWWYGWDYAHSGDYTTYNDEPYMQQFAINHLHEKKWLVGDVEKDSWSTIYEFKKLMRLCERIKEKLNSEPNVQVSDTTEADSSNVAGSKDVINQ